MGFLASSRRRSSIAAAVMLHVLPAPPIRFGVALPASWWFRGAQLGGSGMNGTIPRLTGGVGRGGPTLLQQGFATYGSDSGHQMGGFGMPGGGMGMPGGAARGGAPG